MRRGSQRAAALALDAVDGANHHDHSSTTSDHACADRLAPQKDVEALLEDVSGSFGRDHCGVAVEFIGRGDDQHIGNVVVRTDSSARIVVVKAGEPDLGRLFAGTKSVSNGSS